MGAGIRGLTKDGCSEFTLHCGTVVAGMMTFPTPAPPLGYLTVETTDPKRTTVPQEAHAGKGPRLKPGVCQRGACLLEGGLTQLFQLVQSPFGSVQSQ